MNFPDIPAWLQVVAAAGAVYAGIRADLATLREKAEQAAASANRAHLRIDQLVTMRPAEK